MKTVSVLYQGVTLTVSEADGESLAVRGEADAASGFLQQLTVEHSVLRADVPHAETLVITDCRTGRLAGVHRQPPQLTLAVTLHTPPSVYYNCLIRSSIIIIYQQKKYYIYFCDIKSGGLTIIFNCTKQVIWQSKIIS